MKWWGWGEEDVFFTHEGKPELAPFIERALGLDVRRPGTSAIAFEDLEIPAAALPPACGRTSMTRSAPSTSPPPIGTASCMGEARASRT